MPKGVYEHKPRNEETKKNISDKMKGKQKTDEHKKNLSEAKIRWHKEHAEEVR